MKKASLALVIGAALALSACGSDKKETNSAPAEITTETQQHSYALGARMGSFAKEQLETQEKLGLASDKEALAAGFLEAYNGNPQFTEEEINAFVETFSMKFQAAEQAQAAAEAELAKAASATYFAENGAKEGVVTTDSGLQYEVLTEGEGAKPAAEDTVRVHYHGTLLDGTVFDSSVDRGEPAEFPLNRVIPGWTEGVQLMNVGSKYRFHIPSDLAYGARSTGKIKANSTLIFEVELLDIAPFEN